ncbi:FtsX-like permease family protein [Luteococcus sp. OSA5]|uniref:FtsX-like permease family protein n=1 Tax=Luteococcus sp. OSA5 TaxID=3401630 RepID=UPI003B43642A
MRHLHIAELRGSWTSWLSVSLTFIVVNWVFAVTASCQAAMDGVALARPDDVMTNDAAIGLNYVISTMVGLLVIGTVTGLVIGSRRGSIARLQLAGAAPRHVVGTLMVQLAVVSLVCAILGDLLALPCVQPVLDAHAANQGMEKIPAAAAPVSILMANLACAAVAMLGGLRAALRATRIPPVEALRQSTAESGKRKGTVGRVVWCGLIAGLVGLIFWATPKVRTMDDEKFAVQSVMQATFFLIPLLATFMAKASPITTGLLTRGWTKLVPGRSGTWHLARNTVLGKMDRLERTVVPVMVTMCLLFSMMCLGQSFEATLEAMGEGGDMAGTDLPGLLLVLGAPLAISVAGGLSALLMMARQRTAELALDEILGATPAQRVQVPVLEATIVTVTAFLQALVVTLVVAAFMRLALPLVLPTFKVVLPTQTMVWVSLVIWLATTACTVLPTLGSLRTPPPRVIARLVAA